MPHKPIEKTFVAPGPGRRMCMTPRCEFHATKRGVCNSCYQALRKLWIDEITTEAALVKAGRILPVFTKKAYFLEGVTRALIFVLVAFATPAAAHCLSGGRAAERVLLYAATAADFASTRIAAAEGGVERNPVLGQSAGRQAAIMAVSTVALDCITNHLDRTGWPTVGRTIRRAAIGAHFGLTGWNLSLRWRF